MNKLYVNISKVLTGLIILLGVIYTIWTIMKGSDLKTNLELQSKILNPYFIITLIVGIIATLGALIFPLINVFSNAKSAIRTVIVLAILAAIYGISWALADGNIEGDFYAKFDIDEWTSRFIGALINVVYILGGLAIISTIWSGIHGFFLKR